MSHSVIEHCIGMGYKLQNVDSSAYDALLSNVNLQFIWCNKTTTLNLRYSSLVFWLLKYNERISVIVQWNWK